MFQELNGDPRPEHEWPPEDDWRVLYPHLFPDSSSELEDDQEQVGTSLLMLIPSITPPLISTPIITTPRPPSLHLKGPGDIPTSVDLVCLQSHRASPIWNVCRLMR